MARGGDFSYIIKVSVQICLFTFLFPFFLGVLGGKVKLSAFSFGFFNFEMNVGVKPIARFVAGFSPESEVLNVSSSTLSCTLEALLIDGSSFNDFTSHFSVYGE